jgi:hypothetical protein
MKTYTQRLHSPPFTNQHGDRMPNDTGWQTRHMHALAAPRNAEGPIVALLSAWALYADYYAQKLDTGVGADYVLGPAWAQIGDGIRQLLNGETGRLDCGTLDGFLCDTLGAEGFNPDDL